VGIVGQELARLATPLDTSRDRSGLVLPGVTPTNDYDNDARPPSNIDIGADELVP
jgi:hypothetical protein